MSAWLSRLWPGTCAICHAWPSQRLCTSCMAQFLRPAQRCRTCAITLPGVDGVVQCGACLTHPPPLDACVAAVDYDWPWSRLVGQYKFQHDHSWAHAFAALLLHAAPQARTLIDACDLLVPIPLSRQRLRERGFNQAQLLARHLAVPTRARHKLHAQLLQRVRHTEAQSDLTRAQRMRNLRTSFMVAPAHVPALAHRHVLLVDDVMTTGATLHAAARTLRRAGAASVSALVLARTA